jgi:hypothetical protein
MTTQFKTIKDFPNYIVYKDGRVRHKKKNTFLKLRPRNGYLRVSLENRDGDEAITSTIGVHRLVAQAFIPNPENKPNVGHTDNNRKNNHVDNLSWVTQKENIQHNFKTGHKNRTVSVIQLDLETGEELAEYDSLVDAHRAIPEACAQHISKVCNGERNHTGGFGWKYKEERKNDVIIEDYVEIDGFPNYMIDENGNIYTKKLKRLLKPQKSKDGYMCINLYKNEGKPTSFSIHKLVALTFVDNPDNKPHINHINNIKNDNRAENLEWVTVAENNQHSYDTSERKGTRKIVKYEYFIVNGVKLMFEDQTFRSVSSVCYDAGFVDPRGKPQYTVFPKYLSGELKHKQYEWIDEGNN